MPIDNKIGARHGMTCRDWGGRPFMSLAGGNTVNFNAGAPITVYASSLWAKRRFCRVCGSHLFYRLQNDGLYFVLAGSFNDIGDAEFDHPVFIDQKPVCSAFTNQTQNMTGAEMFAKFAAPT